MACVLTLRRAAHHGQRPNHMQASAILPHMCACMHALHMGILLRLRLNDRHARQCQHLMPRVQDIGTLDSGLNSMVLASNNEMVLLPLNEPTFGTRRKSQIQVRRVRSACGPEAPRAACEDLKRRGYS